MSVVERCPPAITAFIANAPASTALVEKAIGRGLPANLAHTACAVLGKVIKCLDDAGRMNKRTYGRAKLMETALEACREPVASALRVGMVACPVDGRAMLRLWRHVCEPGEQDAMINLLQMTQIGVDD
jgi:hypothetical protein